MTKSQREFWMQVQGATKIWTFYTPLTLELEVERAMHSSISIGTFRIYNLAQSTRSDIYADWPSLDDFRPITLRGGYLSWINVNGPPKFQSLPLIFLGSIKKAYSQREGSSWVTTIQAWDGGYSVTQGDISTPITPSPSLSQQEQLSIIVNALINAMPDVTLGYLDPALGISNIRGVSLSGSPWVKLNELANFLYANLWIDLGKVYMLSKKTVGVPALTGGLGTITPLQGLLETPSRQDTLVSFEMIFEPRVKVGQAIILQSLETVNNGKYVIHGINHHGVISNAVGGDLRTKISCYDPKGYKPYGANA